MTSRDAAQKTAPPAAPGVWKAMAILNALDGPLLEKLLQHFDRGDLARINALDVELEPVEAEDFTSVIEEFAMRFARRVRMLGDYRKPVGLLEEVLTPEEVARLSEPEEENRPPVWSDERFSRREVLEPILASEHPQTAAFLISRIDEETGAGLLQALREERRNDILLRLLDMRPVTPGVLMLVENHIRVSFIEDSSAEKSAEARARIAGIVNRMDKEHAELFLATLGSERPEEAKRLKQLLFSFEDIGKLSEKDRLVLFDKAPAEIVIQALSGAPEDLVELALSALGGRVRKMVEAELRGGNPPQEADIQAARRRIAALALELAAAGEMTIEPPEEGAES